MTVQDKLPWFREIAKDEDSKLSVLGQTLLWACSRGRLTSSASRVIDSLSPEELTEVFDRVVSLWDGNDHISGMWVDLKKELHRVDDEMQNPTEEEEDDQE